MPLAFFFLIRADGKDPFASFKELEGWKSAAARREWDNTGVGQE